MVRNIILSNYPKLSKLLQIVIVDGKNVNLNLDAPIMKDVASELNFKDYTYGKPLSSDNHKLLLVHFKDHITKLLLTEAPKNGFYFNPNFSITGGQAFEKVLFTESKSITLFGITHKQGVNFGQSKKLRSTALTNNNGDIFINTLIWGKEGNSVESKEGIIQNELAHSLLIAKYNFVPNNELYHGINWKEIGQDTPFNNVIDSINLTAQEQQNIKQGFIAQGKKLFKKIENQYKHNLI